ncbi:MAG: hypothetical protein Q7J66_26905 [Hydrogenophaga sp.]|nr:hypothetical protein [Hydrogenophaga sp.]
MSNKLVAMLASIAANLLGKLADSADCPHWVSTGDGWFMVKSLGSTLLLMRHWLPALRTP